MHCHFASLANELVYFCKITSRKRKRLERFGGSSSITTGAVDPDLAEKLEKRAKRFATQEAEN